MATSMIDYVFRVLAFEYLGRTDLVQVAPELVAPPETDEAPVQTPAASAAFPNWDGPKRAAAPTSGPLATSTPAVGEGPVPSRAPATSNTSAQATDAVGTATALVAEAAEHDARVLPPSGDMARAEETVPVVTIVHDIPGRTPIPGSNGHGHANGSANGHGHANGSANGHAHNGNDSVAYLATATQTKAPPMATQAPSALDASLGHLMGDAPFCDVCGHITVRNGACYKCLNCGNSLGCS